MNSDMLTNENEIIEAGHPQLSASQIVDKIAGKTVFGDYGQFFKFVSCIEKNGKMEGKNNAGAHDFGEWSVDESENTFSVIWKNGWESTTTRAYSVGEKVMFFDAVGGEWRNTFSSIVEGCQRPVTMPEVM